MPSDSGGSSVGLDAKARREARKARILGAGSDRLARITKTGRGGEADALYSSPPKPLGGAPMSPDAAAIDTTSTQAPGLPSRLDDDEVLQRANAALQGNTGQEDDDPLDVDISQGNNNDNPFMAMMAQQQQQGFSGQAQQEMPQDLQGMIRSMQEAMMGAGQGHGQGLGGNAKGLGAQPMPNFAFPPGAMSGNQQAVSTAPSLVDAFFNVLRALVFAVFGIALVYGALIGGRVEAQQSVSESASAQLVDKFEHMSTLHRWARLAYERPAHWEARFFGVESFGLPIHGIPVFWLFITLEIGLSSMRIMLQRRRPPPPGLLLKVASFIPNANIQLLLRALASYLPLLDAFVNDVAIVVFTIGCAIMFASWNVGMDPLAAPSDGTATNPALSASIQQLSDAAKGAAAHAAGVQANVDPIASPM